MQIEVIAYSKDNGTVIYREGDTYFTIAPPYIPATVTEISDPTSSLETSLDYDLIGTRDIITSYEELSEWVADVAAPTAIHRSRNLPLHQPQPQRQRQSRPDEAPTLF